MTTLLDWCEPNTWRPWIARQLSDGAAAQAAERARQRFTALRAFHAARPVDTESYHRKGIAPLDRAGWSDLVEECFLSQVSDPQLVAAILQARDTQFELADGRIHFTFDERLLNERDGYTLIYGSLSLLAVAIRIDKQFGTDLKSTLRARGEPAVFVCDVPLELIEDHELVGLLSSLHEAHVHAKASGALPSPFSFHFSIPYALPPRAVVGHHRPDRVMDIVYGHHIGAERMPAASQAVATADGC
jgi:hypothetical protein